MVDERVNEIAKKIVPLYVVEGLLLDGQKTQTDMANMIVEALKKERESLRAELSMKINNAVANTIPSQDAAKRGRQSGILRMWLEMASCYMARFHRARIGDKSNSDWIYLSSFTTNISLLIGRGSE
ncbi:hypothetical protein Tco_1540056 [Tanacetum coccineum]